MQLTNTNYLRFFPAKSPLTLSILGDHNLSVPLERMEIYRYTQKTLRLILKNILVR